PLCSRVDFYFVFCLMIPLPPGPTLFPYTTLFRSSSLITHYSLLLFDAIHACSGVVHDIAPGFLREAAERFVNELLRLRPSGGGMGVVRGPHGVVCPVEVKRLDEHRLVNEGRVHLPLD